MLQVAFILAIMVEEVEDSCFANALSISRAVKLYRSIGFVTVTDQLVICDALISGALLQRCHVFHIGSKINTE